MVTPGRDERLLLKRTFYYGWIVVVVSFTTVSLVSPVGTTFQLFYQAFKQQFQWSHAGISGVFGLHQFLNGAISPAVGWLLDRFGTRRVMPAGALILGSGLILTSQVERLWQLYITFGIVAAVGMAMIQSVPNTVVVANWFLKHRGTATGIVLAGTGLGQLWLTPVTQWLILTIGWRATYLVLAPVIALIPALLIMLFQYHRPSDIGLLPYGQESSQQQSVGRQVIVVDREWAATEWTLRHAARTFRFWALALTTFAFALGFFLVSPQLFVLTQERPEFQRRSLLIALVLGTSGLHKGWSKFVGGMVSDYLGRERTMAMSVGLILVGLYTLSMSQADPSAWLFFVAVFLFSTGYGLSMPVMIAAYGDIFHGPRFGSIVGCLTFVGLVGAAIGSSVGGLLRDLTESYQVSFIMSAVAFAVAAWMMWQARPSSVRRLRTCHVQRSESQGVEIVVEERVQSGGERR